MSPRETRSALVVLALLLPCLAILWWAGRLGGSVDRPGALRAFSQAGQDRAAFVFGGALHLLDAQGRRLARQPLADLGLAEEPTDIDVTTGPDGRLQAWLLENAATPRLVRCEVTPARLQGCAAVLQGAQLAPYVTGGAVHIAVDASGQRLFLAAASRQQVQALALDGRHLGASAPGLLFFPNRLRLDGGQLVVADNDHHRLLWLDVEAGTPSFATRRSLDLRAHPAARPGRKAADFALMPGEPGQPAGLWLLAVAQGQKDGQVLLYGPGLAPRGEAQAGGFHDPLMIDRLGADLLAADFDGIALYRIAADGRFLGEFGDAALRGELAAARGRITAAQAWKYVGWAALALTLVVGTLLAVRHSQRPSSRLDTEMEALLADASAAVPLEPLELRPGREHPRREAAIQVSWLLLMAGLLALAFMVLRPGVVPRLPGLAPGISLAALVALLAVVLLLVWRSAAREAKRTLWLGAGRIEVRRAGRTIASTTPALLRASPRALLVDGTLLPYRRGILPTRPPGRWVFDRYQLTRYVLAHLGPAQRVSDQQIARLHLRRLPWWHLGLLVAPVVIYLGVAVWNFSSR